MYDFKALVGPCQPVHPIHLNDYRQWVFAQLAQELTSRMLTASVPTTPSEVRLMQHHGVVKWRIGTFTTQLGTISIDVKHGLSFAYTGSALAWVTDWECTLPAKWALTAPTGPSPWG